MHTSTRDCTEVLLVYHCCTVTAGGEWGKGLENLSTRARQGQEGEGDRTGKWMGCQLAITVTRVGEVRLQSAAELALTSSGSFWLALASSDCL